MWWVNVVIIRQRVRAHPFQRRVPVHEAVCVVGPRVKRPFVRALPDVAVVGWWIGLCEYIVPHGIEGVIVS